MNTHRKTVEVEEGDLAVSFMGGTNVELRFDPAAEVDVAGRTEALTRIAFQVDDERAAVAVLRSRPQMFAPSGGGPSGSGAAKPTPGVSGASMPTV